MSPKTPPALLLIDVQKGLDAPGWGARNNPDAEARIGALLAAWRRVHWPVVHVQHMSRNPESPLSPKRPGNAIKPEALPLEGERVFRKEVNSAFIGTSLESWLRGQGIAELVIAGLTTDHCVSTTARMAGNLGFDVTVIEDATATFERIGPDGTHYSAEQMHNTALASLHGEFAEVRSSVDVLSRCLNIHSRPSASAVRSLLAGADLPFTDLPDDLEHFFACGSRESPDGAVGLELYGRDALLRSLVVSPARRGRGCGKALVDAAEASARGAAVQRIFLLTETAEPFFASLGYRAVSRDEAPDAIRASSQFSSLCPASAAFMCKML